MAEGGAAVSGRELRSQLYAWLGNRTSQADGDAHSHETLRALTEDLAKLIDGAEPELDQILRAAGIEYPLGLRGVRDLVNQRDGHLERAREAEDERDRAQQALMAKLTEAGQLRERAEEAERRLANVREMVNRLRAAAGGGVTPGYVLVRIEDMLNGQEPT